MIFDLANRISPETALAAVDRPERESLLEFTKYTFRRYKPDPAHELIAQKLTSLVKSRQGGRLMIFAPPQTGKSELVSIRFPAFWLGNRPDDPVILASYAASLAEDKGGKARDVARLPEYSEIFPEILINRDAARHWTLAPPNRGYMFSAGVGGPVTGHGAMLGIIDDPFENWEQAQSAVFRKRVWEWWQGTFRTRIWENGVIVLIMTRWHEDDLAGRLLKRQPGKWEVLRLPALAETQKERDENNAYLGLQAGEPDPAGREPGEPLAPSRYSGTAMEEIKVEVGSRVWAAEYQGVPRPAEGDRVKREWLILVKSAPIAARRVRAWDKAGTTGAGDWTAGVLMAESNGIYYIEDVVRGQWSALERSRMLLQTAILDAIEYGSIKIIGWGKDKIVSAGRCIRCGRKLQNLNGAGIASHCEECGIDWMNAAAPELDDFMNMDIVEFIENEVIDPGPDIWIEQEGGSGGKDSAGDDVRLLAGYKARAQKPAGSKEVRFESFAAQAEAKNIRVVNGDWNMDYINEIASFPNSTNDDQVDATSLAFSKLARPRSVRLHSTTA